MSSRRPSSTSVQSISAKVNRPSSASRPSTSSSKNTKNAWQEKDQKPSKDHSPKKGQKHSSVKPVPEESASETESSIAESEQSEDPEEGDQIRVPEPIITLEHLKACQVGSSLSAAHFSGCTRRSELTGVISMKEDRYMPNFLLIDLFTRQRIFGTPEELMEDEYIFVFEAMSLRTWIFHSMMKNEDMIAEATVDANLGMLVKTLDQRVVDAKVQYGERSPLLFWMLCQLCMSVTGDQILCLLGLLITGCMSFVTTSYNTPESFRQHRIWAIPLRIIAIGVMMLRISMQVDVQLYQIVAIMCGIGVLAWDFFTGDWAAVRAYRFMCQYKIIKEIPPRVFCCKRDGAAHIEEDLVGDRPKINEMITGFTWARGNVLIADLNGLLVELRRPRLAEFKALLHDYQQTQNPCGFISFGCYTPDRPTWECLAENLQEVDRVRIVKQHQKDHPVTWSMVNYWEKQKGKNAWSMMKPVVEQNLDDDEDDLE